ncbi:ABC transporter permease [Paraburkholderia caledonica]|uniref:Peptide/nickel transport system permease protein n=1 Tax=Paraburkholderia caledonica TaxID=134536 RepID=A0AB73IPF6_9BURK|nr:peptide/nickel transport system permease protein [Paraburkholderia caledonica]
MKKSSLIVVVVLGLLILMCLLAPLLPLPRPTLMDIAGSFKGSSWAHPLGQDQFGRSVLSRVVWGMRTSLFVAIGSSLLAAIAGTVLGLTAGYVRGILEVVIMRAMDVMLCLPALLLAMLIVTLYGAGLETLIPVIGLVYLPRFTRVSHSAVLTVRSQEYVEAARTIGAGTWRIMLRTILPNVAAPIIVQLSLAAAAAVMLESGLSYLGLGIAPPAPSLGMMIGDAQSTMSHAVWLLIWPCLALTVLTYLLNSTCDALRDWLDPRRNTRAK